MLDDRVILNFFLKKIFISNFYLNLFKFNLIISINLQIFFLINHYFY